MRTALALEIAFFTLVQANWEPWEEQAWDEYIADVEAGATSVRFPA
jgi:hypothetical protein